MRRENAARTKAKRLEQRARNLEAAEDAKAAFVEASMARTLEIRAQQQVRNAEAMEEMARGRQCGPLTPRCQFARNMRVMTPECCKGHVRRIMAELARLLDEAGIRWWLDYGSLLGYVRDGGMIPWDKDGDLGVHGEDRSKLLNLMPAIVNAGFYPTFAQPRKERFRTGDRMKVRLSRRNWTNVDLFIWYPRPSGLLERRHYIGADLYKGREFPASWVFPLQRGQWDGIDVSVPAEPEKLCEWRYGPGWRTPEHKKHPDRERLGWKATYPEWEP